MDNFASVSSGRVHRRHTSHGPDVDPAAGQGRRGEVRGATDGQALAYRTGGRVEGDQPAALVVDDPDGTAAEDRGTGRRVGRLPLDVDLPGRVDLDRPYAVAARYVRGVPVHGRAAERAADRR